MLAINLFRICKNNMRTSPIVICSTNHCSGSRRILGGSVHLWTGSYTFGVQYGNHLSYSNIYASKQEQKQQPTRWKYKYVKTRPIQRWWIRAIHWIHARNGYNCHYCCCTCTYVSCPFLWVAIECPAKFVKNIPEKYGQFGLTWLVKIVQKKYIGFCQLIFWYHLFVGQ